MSIFVSFTLFGFTLVRKLKNFILKVIEKYFSTKNDMTSDLNMCHGKVADFVSFLLFEFTFFIKQKFRFWKSLKFFLFNWKKMMSDLIRSSQAVSDIWFKLRCLSRILAISRRIWNWNFIEILYYFSNKQSIVRSKFVRFFFFVLFLFLFFIFFCLILIFIRTISGCCLRTNL